jgi:spermidine synthase
MDKNWFYEKFYYNSYSQGFEVQEVLHTEQSKFQKIEVLQTKAVGRLLLLDGKCMVSEKDEFVYHEVVSHLPFMSHPNAKNILVIGGGDGGVVREFVKHSEIENIDLVEIDERVIEVSKEFFPECTSGLSDSRVTVHATDGIEFIKGKNNYYDIIVIDSTDPEDFALGLFTEEFYGNVKRALKTSGIMINQTENPFYDEFDLKEIYQNMRNHFSTVRSYHAPMMIYPGTYWTFGYSSNKTNPLEIVESKKEKMRELQKTLKWYNMDWHLGTFATGNFHKKIIGELL